MAQENFSIGAFYNITKNQDNPIKTVGRDTFLSPKTPKNTSFLGVTQPPEVAQPLYSRGHNQTQTYNIIGSKTAEKNSAQTNRHYENNGHLAVNQHCKFHDCNDIISPGTDITVKGYSLRFSISGAAQEKGSIESSTVGFMYASMTAAFGNPAQKYQHTEYSRSPILQPARNSRTVQKMMQVNAIYSLTYLFNQFSQIHF